MKEITEYSSVRKNNYDKRKIRTLLISDLHRFCKEERIVNSLKATSKAGDILKDLRQIVANLKYGKETVYAAVTLSIFNDPSGVSILKNHHKYWGTDSQIEKLHVRAAMILLHENVGESFKINHWHLSPELYRLIAEPK